ncbi:MAG: bifunctional (p)ppGpp synthetase/guanosine-3',5'-bis(diphosphate) 3'-pyrophosphohydrolase, partial [Bacteroidales bacterium]|nr:bifunctional (p)ppGpp synthetase/guanosine-3',5'-bis(diphosphate) 3'-pyrophosphohydrolase [Bacteroidales bacterium]
MVLQKDISFVVDSYRKLLAVCYHSLDKAGKNHVRQAYQLLIDEYQCKKMESGEYYISHAVAVTVVVIEEIGLTSDSIVSTLLHNVLSNTNISLTDIEAQFSENIAATVNGLARISRLSTQRTSLNAENFIKLLLTISGDVRVILIRLADRLEYMRKMDRLSEKMKHQIAVETAHLYAPIAHRLGLYHIKIELDELSMKYAQPEIYNDIKNKLIESSNAREAYITEFIDPIATSLDNHGFQCDIKGRVKSISSIWKKMKLQNVDINEVYDLFAIRIINKKTKKDEKNDCWEIYSIVTNIFQPNPKRLRDWITTPKPSGYESLHTTVIGPHRHWVEVQIRS